MIISYDKIIQINMTTLSVPLTEDLLKGVNHLVKQGVASNKAEVVRQALKKYLEEQAVEAVLKATNEPNLKGDLDSLAKKL